MSYLNRKSLTKQSEREEVAEISGNVQQSLVNNFYVHSKVRNFNTNKQYVNIDNLGKLIDKKLNMIFQKSIQDAENSEKEIYKIVGVSNVDELQERLFNLNDYEKKLNDNLSIYNVMQKIADEYDGQEMKSVTGAQLSKDLQREINRARDLFFSNLYKSQEIILNKDKKKSAMALKKIFTETEKNLLNSIDKNSEIDVSLLLSGKGYNKIANTSNYQGELGEIKAYCAGLKERTIQKVESELTKELNKKNGQGKTDVSFVLNDEVRVNLSSKNYRTNTSKNATLKLKVHDGKKLSKFIRDMGKINNSTDKVINFFTYNLVNALAFSRSGAVDSNGKKVEHHDIKEFEFYNSFQDVIKKTAMYWLGMDALEGSNHYNQKNKYYNINFLYVNNVLIPMSEILKDLKQEMLQYNVKASFVSVPTFGPFSLWRNKQQVIRKLDDNFYEKGTRNYPQELIKQGSSIGKQIANLTQVNVELKIAVDRLIR